MSDKPIIFSAAMVDALLRGRKSQTRRVLKPQPSDDMDLAGIYAPKLTAVFGYETPDHDLKIPLRFMPGDRLWVREKYAIVPSTAYRMSEGVQQIVSPFDTDMSAVYAAGWERSKPSWKSPMFMPKWASRIALIITDVRVQRLQDISETDALAEGVPSVMEGNIGDEIYCSLCDGNGVHAALGANYGVTEVECAECFTAVQRFRNLWDRINAKRGFGWNSNPWIATYSFEVIKANIDTLSD